MTLTKTTNFQFAQILSSLEDGVIIFIFFHDKVKISTFKICVNAFLKYLFHLFIYSACIICNIFILAFGSQL